MGSGFRRNDGEGAIRCLVPVSVPVLVPASISGSVLIPVPVFVSFPSFRRKPEPTCCTRLFEKLTITDTIALARLAAQYGLADPAHSL